MRWLMGCWIFLWACSDETNEGFGADADVASVGAACGGAFACPRGLVCVDNGAGASTCMLRCPNLGGLCSDGPLCVELAGQEGGVCYIGGFKGKGAECDSTLQCSDGMGCIGADVRFCVPLCQVADGFGCGGDARCVAFSAETGRCQDRVGSKCEADPDCGDATLVCQGHEDPWRAFSGSCTRRCAADAECGGDGACLVQGEASLCADGCARTGHCRAEDGFICAGADDCAGRNDEVACRALLGSKRVCARLE